MGASDSGGKKMKYVYEDHLSGRLYTTENEIHDENLYCPMCSDSDSFIAQAETVEELITILGEDDYPMDEDEIRKLWDTGVSSDE